MKPNSFIFIDFETGGLNCRTHAVTEVAAIAVKGDTFEKIDLVSTYIKPYGNYQYDKKALEVTGISFEDIENGIAVEKAVDELISLFKRSNLYKGFGTQSILVAHNSKFDKGFLLQLFEHTKKIKELEKLVYGGEDYYGKWQPEFLDTIIFSKLAWQHDPEMMNFKLNTCISKAGIELPDAHKAINDTIGLKDLVVNLSNKLRSDNNTFAEELTENTRFRKYFQF